MDTIPDSRKGLRLQRDRILSSYDTLRSALAEARETDTADSAALSGFFSYLLEEFDRFSTLVKQAEAPEDDPELLSIKEEVSACFDAFADLRRRYESGEILCREPDLSEDTQETEPDMQDPGDTQPPETEDSDQAARKRPRVRRPPVRLSGASLPAAWGSQKAADQTQVVCTLAVSSSISSSVSSGTGSPVPGMSGADTAPPPEDHSNPPTAPPHREPDGPAPPGSPPRPSPPVSLVPGKSAHHYHLERITQNLGGGVYAVVQQEVHRAAAKTDNDVIRAGLNTGYYISTGAAAGRLVGGMVRSPVSGLQLSGQRTLSSREMGRYSAGAVRRERELSLQIAALQKVLSSPETMRRSPAERRAMEQTLKQLKSRMPEAAAGGRLARKVQNFQHQRDLDQAVLQAFTEESGRIPHRAAPLRELGTGFLRTHGAEITRRYGQDSLELPVKAVETEIRRQLRAAHSLKSQIELLERRGSRLTSEERKHLLTLRKQKQDLGKKIGSLKDLKRALEDHAYLTKQTERVITAAFRRRQDFLVTAGFLRNLILRPLYQPDNNTEALAYGLNFAAKPAVIRNTAAAVRTAAAIPGKVVYAAAPEAVTRIQYEKQMLRSRLVTHARTTGRQVLRKAPASLRSGVEDALHRKKAFQEKLHVRRDSLRNGKKRLRQKISGTGAARFLGNASEVLEKITEFFKRAGALLKGAAAKGLLIVLAAVLVLSLIPQIVAVITGLCSSIVLSPHEGENGKIDLGPYLSVIEQEKRKFTARRDDLEQEFYEDVEQNAEDFVRRYNRPPRVWIVGGAYEDQDSGISVTFDGPAGNDREIIAMTAVRFQQDLEAPEVKRYLQYMAEQGRELETIHDKTFYHRPGCVTLMQEKETSENPGGSHVLPGIRSHVTVPTDPVYEEQYICPGHRMLEIHIHTLTPEELYSADTFPDSTGDWEGWTEDNRQWVEALLSMDWAELYTGFSMGGILSASSAISPEEEQHIWDFLHSLTGNPFGAAGIMGNLHCESRLLSTNLEDQYERILGYDNDSYTAAVDSGAYQNFIHDSAGYGLAQWTYHTRKAGLLHMARSRGASVGSLDLQLDYLAHELRGTGLSLLSSCGSVGEASDYMLFRFENPANAASLRETRLGISNYYYNKYMLGTAAEGELTQAQMDVIRIATNSGAYGIPARGGYCQAWAAYVYGKAGFPIDGSSCARVSGERYGVSSDFTIVPPGAAVYGYSSSRYGHVGIYVGGGLVYHNVGGVAVDSLSDWVRKFNGFCWGWQAGTDLTAQP